MPQTSQSIKYPRLRLRLNLNNNIYYSCRKVLSYAPAMIICIGGRGIGKTTSYLIQALQYCNDGYEFIYTRRYKDEIATFNKTGTLDNILPGVISKSIGSGSCVYTYDDRVLGYGIPLTMASKFKSAQFPKVKMIIFDEGILPPKSPQRYLPDEVTALFEFMSTVFRTREKTLIAILGNNLDLFNPYFAYFNVPIFDDFYWDRERGLVCEKCKNSENLLKMEEKTSLYKLTKGTAYANYHYDNKVLLNREYNYDIKPSDGRLLCRIIVNEDMINIYMYTRMKKDLLYVEHRTKKIHDLTTFELINKGQVNYTMVNRYKIKFKVLIQNYYFGNAIFYSDDKAGGIVTWLVNNM